VAGREIEDAKACLALEDSSELTPPSPYDLLLGLCSLQQGAMEGFSLEVAQV